MPGVNPANYPRLYWDLRPTVNGRGANRHNLANFIELTGWIQYQIDNEFIEIAGIIYAENGLHLKSVDTANEDDATTVHLGGFLIEDTTINQRKPKVPGEPIQDQFNLDVYNSKYSFPYKGVDKVVLHQTLWNSRPLEADLPFQLFGNPSNPSHHFEHPNIIIPPNSITDRVYYEIIASSRFVSSGRLLFTKKDVIADHTHTGWFTVEWADDDISCDPCFPDYYNYLESSHFANNQKSSLIYSNEVRLNEGDDYNETFAFRTEVKVDNNGVTFDFTGDPNWIYPDPIFSYSLDFDSYTFPRDSGDPDEVLTTDGVTQLRWESISNLIDTGLINAESGLHIKESHTGDPNDADTVHLGGKLLEDTFIDLIEIDYDTPRDLEISGLAGATTGGPSGPFTRPYENTLAKYFTKWEWENKVDDPMIDYLFLWNDENELTPGLNNRFYRVNSSFGTDPGDIFVTNDETQTKFSKNDINFTKALLGTYATDRDSSYFGGDRLFSHAEFSTLSKGISARSNSNKPQAFISTGSRILPIGVEPNINNDWAFKNEIYLDDSGISFRFTNTGAPGNFPSPNGSYLFPTSDGTENQVLTTDGSGVLRWEDPCCTDLLVDADYLCLNAWLGVEGKGPPLDTESTISEVFEAVFELLCDALLNIETLQNQVETLQEEVDTLQCFHTNINIQGVIVNDDSDPGATGSIDLNVTNGEAPYTYSWTSIPAGFTATTKNIRNLSPITYIVEVTDNNGCQETAQFDVLQEAAPADPTLQLFTSCVNFTRDWEGNINTGILTNINPNIVMTDYDIQFITEGIMLGSSPTEMATCGLPWSDDPLWATNYNNQAGSPSFGAITANPTDTYGSLNFGGVASCDYDDVYASAVTVVITINGNYVSPASPIVNKTFVGVIPAHSFGQQGTLPPDQAVCVDFYESVIV